MIAVTLLFLISALTVSCLGVAQDSHEGLRAFDLELQELVERAKEEREAEGNGGEASPALLAEIGMRYWERDTRWLQGGLQEALTYMSRARELTPPDKPQHLFTRTLHQGVLQSALGLLSDADATFHAALEAARGSGERASVLFHWGSMLAGREPQQSHARLIDSLRLGPCSPEAPSARLLLAQSYALLDGATEQGWRDIIRLLEEQSGGCAHISQSGQVSSATAQTHRALFVAEDALGQNRTKAWAHLLQANSDDLGRLQRSPRSATGYSLKASQAEVKHIVKTGFLPPPTVKVGSQSRLPVFIVGFPRSGSTLLETMLDAHPSVFGLGEASAVPYQVDLLEAELKRRQDAAMAKRQSFESEFRLIVAKHADKLLQFMRARAAESGRLGPVKRVVDKTLRNSRNLAQILLLFPNATIIHTTRSPMDTLFSCLQHHFGSPNMVYTLHEASLAEEYDLYRQVMAHWSKALPAGRVLEVRYEDLVCRPDDTMRRVLDHMKLPWHEAVLRHHEKDRKQVKTASALQVRRSVYTSSIGAWERYAAQLEPLAKRLGEVPGAVRADTPCDAPPPSPFPLQ